MINGMVVGMDSFGKANTFSKVFRKLIESYALDAVDWFNPEKEYKSLKSKVTKFIKSSQTAKVEAHESVGMGTDCRMESKNITGFALALDNRILHLSMFSQAAGQNWNMGSSRMSRYTQRRKNRVY